MDKQKQIEEMAKTYCPNRYSCNKDCIVQKTEICDIYETCEKLYNVGYRKITENEIVLSNEKFLELSNKYSQKEVDLMVEFHKIEASKETAEKFAERLKEVNIRFELTGNKYSQADIKEAVEGLYNAFMQKIDEICKGFTEG